MALANTLSMAFKNSGIIVPQFIKQFHFLLRSFSLLSPKMT